MQNAHITKKQLGFTLAELLVSISIFIMITTIVLADFKSNSRSQQVKFNAQDLSSVIRKAQFMSQFGRTTEHNGNVVPIGGYGVYITQCATPPCEYLIFADYDGELDYDIGEEVAGETYTFPPTIIVPTVTQSPLSLVFKPPRPLVCVNQDCSKTNDAVITIKQQSTTDTAIVSINPLSGKVSVE